MSYGEPLAKSGEPPLTLAEHLRQVADYARAVTEAYRPHWQRLLGEEWASCVSQALILAALAHDLGKAADGFQQALQSRRRGWNFRHEVLSAALLLSEGLKEGRVRLAAAAVLTHHRDLTDSQLCNDAGLPPLPDPQIVEIAQRKFHTKAGELRANWEWLRSFCHQHLQLQLPDLPDKLLPPTEFLRQLKSSLHETTFQDREATALLLARGWLMAADHAASAGVAEFKAALPTPRLPELRPFQRRAGGHEGDAFLEAPTGAGKTIAALCWALRNRKAGERIFYLLPYQASIEAMADVLERQFGRENVAVLHARALDYAFREHFERVGEYEAAYAQARWETELNRLAHKPIKVATPFQLLKWLFGVPRFEIGISEMVGGLFIFDEIHAYDAHVVALIAEMVRALKRLGGRFLFMSATFPPFLKELLQKALGEEATDLGLSVGDDDGWTCRFLTQARHRLRWHDEPLEALLPEAVRAAREGKRVLIVANRVAQAQEIYQALREELKGAYLLHSRFARRDRVAKERTIVEALRERTENVRVLVATQVVEVSLDVSFDTIFTEVAPVDDLLQRFGRVNRYGEHPSGVDVHVARRFDEEQLRWVYDLDRIRATLEKAPDDGEAITVKTAVEWVRGVYQGGWTEREQRRFEQAQTSFRSILQALRPLHHAPEGEVEFSGLFQSVEVLPLELYDEYVRHVEEKRYLLATQLLVPIPLGTFHMLNRRGLLNPLSKKRRDLRDGTLIADVRYDAELGLLPTEVNLDSYLL